MFLFSPGVTSALARARPGYNLLFIRVAYAASASCLDAFKTGAPARRSGKSRFIGALPLFLSRKMCLGNSWDGLAAFPMYR